MMRGVPDGRPAMVSSGRLPNRDGRMSRQSWLAREKSCFVVEIAGRSRKYLGSSYHLLGFCPMLMMRSAGRK
jgi:hypothetical protein